MSDDFSIEFDDTPIDTGKEPQAEVPELKYHSQQEFEAAYPGLFQWLLNAKWSTFAQDLALTLQYKGRLSEKQTQAAVQMRERSDAREKARPRCWKPQRRCRLTTPCWPTPS